MRAVIYARYSTDMQSDASIEDQIRICQERIEREGWTMQQCYTDHAVSGASLIRPGIQSLLQDALNGQFDVVVAEDLDRLSRDQEDTAGVFKRMQFANVGIFTLVDGFITDLHVGLKGTMNAIQLKQIAAKVRRGQRGRIEAGKSAGGNAFGYDVVRKLDSEGNLIRGDRTINKAQAAIVVRIFEEYAAGHSPKTIAKKLNKEKVESPSSQGWTQSTLNGNRKRGTGILNNDLYVGLLIHNRLRYLKAPDTGKRVSRLNRESEWIRKDVPEMRIIEGDLWDRVKARQKTLQKSCLTLRDKKRPKYLLSGLLRCGACGGGYSMISQSHVGCSTSRNKGTCNNKRSIKRETLEQRVLGSLRAHLMDEELCKIFCEEYVAHANRLRIEHNASLSGYKKERAKVERESEKMVESILAGVDTKSFVEISKRIADRMTELDEVLETTFEAPTLFHPNMAGRYHEEVKALITSLNTEGQRAEAADLIRGLIDKIILTPKDEEKGLYVDLHGSLAGILSIATSSDRASVEAQLKNTPDLGNPTRGKNAETVSDKDLHDRQVQLVAGVRNSLNLRKEYEKALGFQKLAEPRQVQLVAGACTHRYFSNWQHDITF